MFPLITKPSISRLSIAILKSLESLRIFVSLRKAILNLKSRQASISALLIVSRTAQLACGRCSKERLGLGCNKSECVAPSTQAQLITDRSDLANRDRLLPPGFKPIEECLLPTPATQAEV